MKYPRCLMLGLGVLIGMLLYAVAVFAEGELSHSLPKTDGSGPLKISADGSDPIKSIDTASLSF